MPRTIALRASAVFFVLTLVSGALAPALFALGASLCALMLAFAYVSTPAPVAIPIRVRRDRSVR